MSTRTVSCDFVCPPDVGLIFATGSTPIAVTLPSSRCKPVRIWAEDAHVYVKDGNGFEVTIGGGSVAEFVFVKFLGWQLRSCEPAVVARSRKAHDQNATVRPADNTEFMARVLFDDALWSRAARVAESDKTRHVRTVLDRMWERARDGFDDNMGLVEARRSSEERARRLAE